MKAALNLPGGGEFPDQALAKARGVTAIGWEARDVNIQKLNADGTNHVIEAVRSNGSDVFLFWAPGWYGWPAPETFAKIASDDINRLGLYNPAKKINKQCWIDLDIESDDPDYVLRALREMRRLRPGRSLVWSFQPMKGGIVGSSFELLTLVNSDPMVSVCPFNYRNDMRPVSERMVVRDLLDWGVTNDTIKVYYDRYEEGFDGILYGIK